MKKYYKEISLLALPLLAGQFGNIAVAFADTMMVGHHSTEALSSASFVNNFFNIALFAAMGFSYGLTPLLGALFVRGGKADIGRMLRAGMRINALFTIALMVVMAAVYANLHNLGQPEELLPLIRPYFLLVLGGMVPLVVFNVFSQWSFAIGNTGLPTWILLISNAVNIAGNYALISGHWGCPALGLMGAGISTLTARILCAVAMLWVFFFGKLGAPYRIGYHSSPKPGESRLVAYTGFPVAMQMAFETAAFSGSAIIAGWLGKIPLAAFQIVAVSGMLGFCLYYSIGAAMAIPMSHAAGRHDIAAMKEISRVGYRLILACMTLTCTLFLFGGRHVIGLFSSDPLAVGAAVAVIIPMVLYQFGDATQISYANALRGTSHVRPMLTVAFISYIVVGIPVTYILAIPAGMGLYGIVLSFSVCLMLAGALYYIFFRRALKSVAKNKKID